MQTAIKIFTLMLRLSCETDALSSHPTSKNAVVRKSDFLLSPFHDIRGLVLGLLSDVLQATNARRPGNEASALTLYDVLQKFLAYTLYHWATRGTEMSTISTCSSLNIG